MMRKIFPVSTVAGKTAAIIAVTAFVIFTAAGLFMHWLRSYAEQPGPHSAGAPVVLTIPAGSDFRRIVELLVGNGLIEEDFRFGLLARLEGAGRRLQAGDYLFRGGESPAEVLRILTGGRVTRVGLTVPEGATMFQVADLLDQGGFVSRDDFLGTVQQSGLVAGLGVEAASLEGYLFPDTYYFARGQSAASIAKTMVTRLRDVLAELAVHEENRTGLNLHEVLTLASIIEKETGRPGERPLIASVFLNRLTQGMRLQADPTVIYGLRRFDGDLTREDLLSPSLYNTYLNQGLPPGPIANPGRESIAAVLEPAREDYLYFVSKNDGSHQFSRTLTEHNRAVDTYQKKR